LVSVLQQGQQTRGHQADGGVVSGDDQLAEEACGRALKFAFCDQ